MSAIDNFIRCVEQYLLETENTESVYKFQQLVAFLDQDENFIEEENLR